MNIDCKNVVVKLNSVPVHYSEKISEAKKVNPTPEEISAFKKILAVL